MCVQVPGRPLEDEVLGIGRADLFAAPGQVQEGRVVENEVYRDTAFLRERPSGDEVEDLETELVEAVGQGRIVLPWRNALQVAQVEIGAQVEVGEPCRHAPDKSDGRRALYEVRRAHRDAVALDTHPQAYLQVGLVDVGHQQVEQQLFAGGRRVVRELQAVRRYKVRVGLYRVELGSGQLAEKDEKRYEPPNQVSPPNRGAQGIFST